MHFFDEHRCLSFFSYKNTPVHQFSRFPPNLQLFLLMPSSKHTIGSFQCLIKYRLHCCIFTLPFPAGPDLLPHTVLTILQNATGSSAHIKHCSFLQSLHQISCQFLPFLFSATSQILQFSISISTGVKLRGGAHHCFLL